MEVYPNLNFQKTFFWDVDRLHNVFLIIQYYVLMRFCKPMLRSITSIVSIIRYTYPAIIPTNSYRPPMSLNYAKWIVVLYQFHVSDEDVGARSGFRRHG